MTSNGEQHFSDEDIDVYDDVLEWVTPEPGNEWLSFDGEQSPDHMVAVEGLEEPAGPATQGRPETSEERQQRLREELLERLENAIIRCEELEEKWRGKIEDRMIDYVKAKVVDLLTLHASPVSAGPYETIPCMYNITPTHMRDDRFCLPALIPACDRHNDWSGRCVAELPMAGVAVRFTIGGVEFCGTVAVNAFDHSVFTQHMGCCVVFLEMGVGDNEWGLTLCTVIGVPVFAIHQMSKIYGFTYTSYGFGGGDYVRYMGYFGANPRHALEDVDVPAERREKYRGCTLPEDKDYKPRELSPDLTEDDEVRMREMWTHQLWGVKTLGGLADQSSAVWNRPTDPLRHISVGCTVKFYSCREQRGMVSSFGKTVWTDVGLVVAIRPDPPGSYRKPLRPSEELPEKAARKEEQEWKREKRCSCRYLVTVRCGQQMFDLDLCQIETPASPSHNWSAPPLPTWKNQGNQTYRQ